MTDQDLHIKQCMSLYCQLTRTSHMCAYPLWYCSSAGKHNIVTCSGVQMHVAATRWQWLYAVYDLLVEHGQ